MFDLSSWYEDVILHSNILIKWNLSTQRLLYTTQAAHLNSLLWLGMLWRCTCIAYIATPETISEFKRSDEDIVTYVCIASTRSLLYPNSNVKSYVSNEWHTAPDLYYYSFELQIDIRGEIQFFFMPFSFQLPSRHFVSSLPYVIDFNGETTLKGEKRRRRKKQDNRWGSLFVKLKIYFIFILLWSSLPRIIHKVVSGWYCCHRHSSHSRPGCILILVLVLFVVIAISSDKNK